jgi:RNA polymerase sigma-70 factor (ECF subfamily)
VEQKRDEELLAEHLAGSPGAFEVLVARYADDLYTFFVRFVGNAAAADDLVQETLLQVHLAADTFDPARPFKPWVYTVAANTARDYLRSRGRRPEQSLDAVSADSEAPPPSALVEAESVSAPEQMDVESLTRLVRALIARMPEHLRLILILGYYQRLPYAEIAEILDIPVGTVKSRLHSAVEHFARLWLAQGKARTPPE